MNDYTLEVYKRDARTKSGVRLYQKVNLRAPTKSTVLDHYNKVFDPAFGFIVEVHETFVTRKNLLSGVEFQERYDTPSFCSPSSESFWAN
jgi:hypothetical protein